MAIYPHTDLNRAVLRHIALFKDLPNRALDRLLGSFNLLRYPKGYRVLRQHQPGNNAFYIIRSGSVRVLAADARGQERILCHLHRGEVFGEMEILTGELIAATVETLFDSEFWVLSREDFNAVLLDYPQMAVSLAVLLSRRLTESNKLTYKRPTNHVIAVAAGLSPEKGAFLSINLAAALARDTRRPVLVLDLESRPSPMERLLGHRPVSDVYQFLSPGLYLQPEGIDRAIHRARQGFAVIGLKPAASQRSEVNPSLIPRLLSYVRESFGAVLLHVGGPPDPLGLKALEQSDLVMRLEGTEWPPPADRPGAPACLEVATGAAPEESTSAVQVTLHAQTLLEFLDTGVPVHQSHPQGEEDLDLSKLSRRARNARIGVALGSGTALGWCHVGVLQVLERERIPIDMIAGSSMGACIGGLLAMGMKAGDIADVARSVDKDLVKTWFDYNLPFPRDGLIKGNQLESFIHDLFGETEFKDLLIPLCAVATDIATGERVVLKEGLVYKALRASSAIPGIFRMATIDGRHLVDGGVYETVPAQTLRDEGVQRIIAVNCAQPPDRAVRSTERTPGQLNIFDILMRASEILVYQRNKGLDVTGDVNINPRIPDVTWNELWRGPELIEFGAAAAEAAVGELRRLLEDD